MIKCTKCGADNLLNAVFCRTCGERLDLDSLRPEDFEDTGAQKKGGELSTAATCGVLGGFVLLVLILIAFPGLGKLSPSEPSADVKERFQKFCDDKPKHFEATFTSQEATDILNAQLANFTNDKGFPEMTGISVNFIDASTIKVIISAKLKFLPVNITITGTPNSGSLGMMEDSVKLGLLPVPESSRNDLLSDLRSVFNALVRDANANIETLSISSGQITIGK